MVLSLSLTTFISQSEGWTFTVNAVWSGANLQINSSRKERYFKLQCISRNVFTFQFKFVSELFETNLSQNLSQNYLRQLCSPFFLRNNSLMWQFMVYRHTSSCLFRRCQKTWSQSSLFLHPLRGMGPEEPTTSWKSFKTHKLRQFLKCLTCPYKYHVVKWHE